MAQRKKQVKTVSRHKKVARSSAAQHSVALTKERVPFMTFKFTEQTLYWAIICGMVLALGIWVLTINQRVQALYDEIQIMNAQDIVVLQKKN